MKCSKCGGLIVSEAKGFTADELAAVACSCDRTATWFIAAKRSDQAMEFAELLGLDIGQWRYVNRPKQLEGQRGTVVLLKSAFSKRKEFTDYVRDNATRLALIDSQSKSLFGF